MMIIKKTTILKMRFRGEGEFLDFILTPINTCFNDEIAVKSSCCQGFSIIFISVIMVRSC